jgi:hypothetical protein
VKFPYNGNVAIDFSQALTALPADFQQASRLVSTVVQPPPTILATNTVKVWRASGKHLLVIKTFKIFLKPNTPLPQPFTGKTLIGKKCWHGLKSMGEGNADPVNDSTHLKISFCASGGRKLNDTLMVS